VDAIRRKRRRGEGIGGEERKGEGTGEEGRRREEGGREKTGREGQGREGRFILRHIKTTENANLAIFYF